MARPGSRRALRRHHKRRMKAKARFLTKYIWGGGTDVWRGDPRYEPWTPVDMTACADYLAVCSCDGCGNPRKRGWSSRWGSLTLQERAAELSYKEQLKE